MYSYPPSEVYPPARRLEKKKIKLVLWTSEVYQEITNDEWILF